MSIWTPPEGVHIQNAIIRSVRLTTEDYGCLTMWLDLDYGGSGQGFGGFGLGRDFDTKGIHAKQPNYAAEFITRVMHAAEVMNYSELVGRSVRVAKLHQRDLIHAIGHILHNDRWFCPSETFKSWEAKP